MRDLNHDPHKQRDGRTNQKNDQRTGTRREQQHRVVEKSRDLVECMRSCGRGISPDSAREADAGCHGNGPRFRWTSSMCSRLWLQGMQHLSHGERWPAVPQRTSHQRRHDGRDGAKWSARGERNQEGKQYEENPGSAEIQARALHELAE